MQYTKNIWKVFLKKKILDFVHEDDHVLVEFIANYEDINPYRELNILNNLFGKK